MIYKNRLQSFFYPIATKSLHFPLNLPIPQTVCQHMLTFQSENACMVHTLTEPHHTTSKSGRGNVYMSFYYNPVSSEYSHCTWDSVLHLTQSNDKNHTPGMLDVDVLCHTASPLQSYCQGLVFPTSCEAPSSLMGSACRETHHARLFGRADRSRTGNEDTAPCWSHPSPSHICSWNCILSLCLLTLGAHARGLQ